MSQAMSKEEIKVVLDTVNGVSEALHGYVQHTIEKGGPDVLADFRRNPKGFVDGLLEGAKSQIVKQTILKVDELQKKAPEVCR